MPHSLAVTINICSVLFLCQQHQDVKIHKTQIVILCNFSLSVLGSTLLWPDMSTTRLAFAQEAVPWKAKANAHSGRKASGALDLKALLWRQTLNTFLVTVDNNQYQRSIAISSASFSSLSSISTTKGSSTTFAHIYQAAKV